MSVALAILAGLSLLAWLYLLAFHGRFWRADQRLPVESPAPKRWPSVTAVIPARDEAEFVGRAVRSLLDQDYPGNVAVILVDDRSEDGTAAAARAAAGADERLVIVQAPPLPEGWVGKMNAVQAGVAAVPASADFVLLTDADIEHAPDALRRLVGHAEARSLVLASLMVRLHCRGLAERLLIPAFVFFFQKLYPFPRVNDEGRRLAGAAGGCMLVRRAALEAGGGIQAIRDALIDDCALARRLKPLGPIWLGLAEETSSIRPYQGLRGVWQMVARTAFTQLNHSPLLLAGTLLGMAILYLAPPLLAVAGVALGDWLTAGLATAAWLAMGIAYWPTWRLYEGPGAGVLTLPVAGLLYTLMTLDSARRYWRGEGGRWKGRSYRDPTAYGR